MSDETIDIDANERPREHTGIVLFSSFDALRAIVLDLNLLEQTNELVLKYVSAETSEVPGYIADPIERKKQERRLAVPLVYGNQITWDDNLVDEEEKLIRTFARAYPTLKSETVDGVGKILLDGLISPFNPEYFYTSLFGDIYLPPNQQHEASPNVYVNAWINCNVVFVEGEPQPQPVVTFNSFVGVCSLLKQMDVDVAPWNINNPVRLPPIAVVDYEDDDPLDDFIIPPPSATDQNSLKLSEMDAYLTGTRSFIIIEHPLWKCVMPVVLENIPWIIGRKYLIRCLYNPHEKAYMVYDAKPVPNAEVLATDSTTGFIMCSVNMHPTFRGVFETEIFGLVDDPFGVLKYLHLTKYFDKRIPVSLRDEQPSRNQQFRFSIYNMADASKAKRYKEFLRDNEIAESTIYGVIVENGVVSAEHMPIKFVFGKKQKHPPIGVHISFDAVYDNHTEHFIITNWQFRSDKFPLVVVKKQLPEEITNSEHKQNIYFVTATVVCLPTPESNILHCQEFGVLDDPLNCSPITDDVLAYDVWVKESKREDNYPYRPRTAYHIVARGKDAIIAEYENVSILTDEEKALVELQEQRCQLMQNLETHDEEDSAPILTPSDDEMPISEEDVPEATPASSDLATTQIDDSPESEQRNSPVQEDRHRIFQSPEFAARSRETVDEHGNTVRAPSSYDHFVDDSPNNAAFFASGDPVVWSQEGTDGDEPLTEPLSIVPTNSRHGSSSSSVDTIESTETEKGEIFPNSLIGNNHNRPVEPYNGPVLAPPGSNFTYNIIETISRLKHSVRHGTCGAVCDRECPWLMALAELLVVHSDFFAELKTRYRRLFLAIRRAFEHVTVEEAPKKNAK